MTTVDIIHREPTFSSELRRIQSTWSPREQRLRAERSRRRVLRLFNLIFAGTSEPSMTAVGATTMEDLQRLMR